MSISMKVGGAWKTLTTAHVKVSGTWQSVASVWTKVSGVWQQVYTAFAVTANKAAVTGGGADFTACGNPGSTDTVTVTPVGGKAPYTYAWALVGAAASSGPYQANSPTSAATSFSDANNSVCDADTVTTEQWRCTVTDDNLNTDSVDVNVTLTWADLN